MGNYGWRFPKLDGGPEQGINDGGIATFKGSKMYTSLAREICQNSLDAKSKEKETVIVEFSSLTLRKEDYPIIQGLETIFDDCCEYWQERMEPKLESFLNEAKKKFEQEEIDFLVIRDFNTTGLSGSKANNREKSKWRALTHSNGVTDKAKGSQGSYGIGKNAPFACSSFRTVFYNSYSEVDNEKAFQGVTRVVTHMQGDSETIGVGFYQNMDNLMPIFEEDECLLRDVLDRKEYGTDVVIAGFKKTESWKEDIEKAILANFFVAIADKKLIVRIDDIEIHHGNIKERIKYYADLEQKEERKERNITTILEFYHAFCESDYKLEGKIMEEGDVTLYIKKDDGYSKSIAEMRSIGMVIRTRHNNIFTRYAAVVMVHPGKLNDLLKEIEPPEHNNWDPGLIEDDQKKQDEAKKYRSNLIKWVNSKIVECCRSEELEEINVDDFGAYLPYDEDDADMGDELKNTNELDVDSIFEQAKVSKPNVKKVNMIAKKVKGYKDEEMVPRNNGGGGLYGGSAGIEDPEGPDNVTVPKPGNKSVNFPRVLRQRVSKTPIKTQYRVVFMLENDCPKINLALKAVGDDGKKEKIKIIEYKFGSNKKVINSEHLLVKDIKANVMYEIFLDLEYAEKMQLELLIS